MVRILTLETRTRITLSQQSFHRRFAHDLRRSEDELGGIDQELRQADHGVNLGHSVFPVCQQRTERREPGHDRRSHWARDSLSVSLGSRLGGRTQCLLGTQRQAQPGHTSHPAQQRNEAFHERFYWSGSRGRSTAGAPATGDCFGIFGFLATVTSITRTLPSAGRSTWIMIFWPTLTSSPMRRSVRTKNFATGIPSIETTRSPALTPAAIPGDSGSSSSIWKNLTQFIPTTYLKGLTPIVACLIPRNPNGLALTTYGAI